jgi:AcrR family transcriptional regulator
MAQREAGPTWGPARRRGRPVNADSVETRHRILKASRQVINERGYQAATFQAIAKAAGLSRPTLHYYFDSRAEIYQALQAEASVVIGECIASAQRHHTVGGQFSALVEAIREADFRDRSQIAFLVSASLESTRNPELRPHADTALRKFLTTMVEGAQLRGELSEGVDVRPVAEMLSAMLWGIGFHAGFVDDAANMCLMTRRLDRTFGHGLLDGAALSPAGDDGDDTVGDTSRSVGGRQ